jgi:hypothetical protein
MKFAKKEIKTPKMIFKRKKKFKKKIITIKFLATCSGVVVNTPNRGGTKGFPKSFFFIYPPKHHKSPSEFKFRQVNLSQRKSRRQERGEIICRRKYT